MLRFLFLISLFLTLYGNDFRSVTKLSLKKDEFLQLNIKYAKQKKLFKLRWTLFVNNGLVIHKYYGGTVSQNILYLNHTNQSIRQELKPRGADFYNVPYLLIRFSEFDEIKHEAKFELYLSDEKMQIQMQYIKNS